MTHAVEQVTIDMLQAFADAWNRHDADAIMSFMTADLTGCCLNRSLQGGTIRHGD